MKSVIMVAYFFPPEGSAGSYRPLRFVRQLSKIGWRTAVISAQPYSYERYDPELLNFVPADTEIVRIAGRDVWQFIQAWREEKNRKKVRMMPAELAKQTEETHQKPFRSAFRATVRKIEAGYYYPDMARPWIRPAVEATVKMCARRQPDVLWATAGPISAWIVAQRASRRTGVPYVLDLRDPHGLSYYESEERWPKWARRSVSRTIHELFKGARSVVFLYATMAECYRQAFPGALEPDKIHIIPNGYEGITEDFAPPAQTSLRVLYTGTILSYRYDTLLQALALLKSAHNRYSLLNFLFVGEGTEELADKAAKLGVSNIVKILRPISHNEIARIQREAHVLLVLGRPSSVKGHEIVAGAKLFEYLKAGKPILGVLPNDETRKILSSLGVRTVADVDSPSEIAALLKRLVDKWLTGNLSALVPDRSKCEMYSSEKQTAALVRALQGEFAEQPFVPGSVEVPPSLKNNMYISSEKCGPRQGSSDLYDSCF
jgi:glycosyltransferase involved in cell wall biosynthesis